jgi:CheY-like chemotaxis protein
MLTRTEGSPPVEILLVEDNAGDYRLTQEALKEGKVYNNLHWTKDGVEALDFLRRRGKYEGGARPDLILLDVMMPGIDGYQVCKMIKANKQAMKKTAVVMLTSRSSPFDKLRGSLAGCDEYLTKPLDEDRLLEVIAQFLPSSRKKRDKSGSKQQ